MPTATPIAAPGGTAVREPRNAVVSTYTALSKQVRDAGLLARATGYYLWLVAVLTACLAGLVAGFVLLGHSWFQLLVAAALGVVLTQFAFVTHEMAHRVVFASGRTNDRWGRLMANALVGISYTWWMSKHTRHHANPNHVGKDPDIEPDTILFLEEDAAKRTGLLGWVTRFQGYAFFPLLTLEGLNLHVTSIRSVAANESGRTRVIELTTIAARLAIYLGLVLWALPLGMAFAFLGVQLAVFGVYMGAAFAPNHKGMAIIPAGSKLDFLSKQVLTSRNIRGGRVMNVLMGGLNFQVEHHLFPSMARPHLIAASKLVRAHCAELKMPYTEVSLVESYRIVVAYLNRVGLGERNPFDCPTFNTLRRV
ncbi:MAG: acyl-CoA desaturase [Micrococcales bacterium 73-15]|uniref:fatty acid desaturase family protein n=1 Tax=Salana multivorans TaxID=120377 RepID=UPI000961AB9D|nr:acyl-CoA desaturase [Salana multivorans]OJX95365.1 MAG: acyl-CoA desaturase [Micrococcales bacterium 73-15]